MKKNEKMLQAMELIDEKYVEEADPTKVRRKKKHSMLRGLAIGFAACFALMLTGVNLWLFIPFSTEPPDVSQYSDSEYYPIIEKLNALTYEPPEYKNNYEKLSRSFLMAKGENADGGVNKSPSVKEEPSYFEVTDNQVEGVIEGDLIKRSDQYIYYIDCYDAKLLVYSIEGEDSKQIAVYPFEGYGDPSPREIYLSDDCKTVTVICSIRSDAEGAQTQVVSLDVSHPTAIRERVRVNITGYPVDSRMVDGKLLLLSAYSIQNSLDFADESTFLPRIDSGDGYKSIHMDDIVLPDLPTDKRYTIVCRLDGQTLALEDAAALFSYSSEVYVSTDSLYAIHNYDDVSVDWLGNKTAVAMTEITALSYRGEQFERQGTVTVKGSVKNQYSLDECESNLRVVTTTSVTTETINWKSEEIVSVSRDTSASLYCVDLDSFEVVAEVADFAPKGETVQSVRFDGDSAYVCTAVNRFDPVFFFDLSDLNNITYKDTDAIVGFSTSLIDIGNGYLLGVGVGERINSVKLEIYEESEDRVVSVCSYLFERAYFNFNDYKGILVDRENRLFGLGVIDYTHMGANLMDSYRYVLFHFDGDELQVLVNEQLNDAHYNSRAVYIDGYLYMFSEADVYLSTDEELEEFPEVEENMKVVKVEMDEGE